MNLNLLSKTTFWIEGIDLSGADLGRIAAAAAGALGLRPEEVMVVDVRPGLVGFDVLRPDVPAESVIGTRDVLLRQLASIESVKLSPDASVHSEGVLGLIGMEADGARAALREADSIADRVRQRVARRALVFASGPEVRAGQIRDTNSPYLVGELTQAGFAAERGGVLEDDLRSATEGLEDALGRGFGLIITTGGVGAEDKDFNVEAVLRLDPHAATPWILRFTKDMRRHHKDGVRIAVGRVGPSLLIALPGPHDEVRVACPVLLDALSRGAGDAELAESVAGALRQRWQQKMDTGARSHT